MPGDSCFFKPLYEFREEESAGSLLAEPRESEKEGSYFFSADRAAAMM